MSKSYAPEVIADSTGHWCGSGLRFATFEEAHDNVKDLAQRWTAVRIPRGSRHAKLHGAHAGLQPVLLPRSLGGGRRRPCRL